MRVRHPNIVHLLAASSPSNGTSAYVLVLDLMPNGSLSDRIHGAASDLELSRGRGGFVLATNFFFSVSRDILLALNYLHLLKPPVAHLDLKSGNVLLDAQDRYVCLIAQCE